MLPLVGLSLPAAAFAEAPARPLVRLLGGALADETGRVPILATLPDGASAESVGLVEVAPGIGAIRLDPSEVEAFGDEHPELALFAGPPKRALLDVSVPSTGAPVFRKQTGSDGHGAIVGIVDTGIDLTHPAFFDGTGHTRVAWLLTAGMPRGLHPDVEAAMGCTDARMSPCAVFSGADIDALLASKTALPSDMHDVVGHGTHVTSIAAGNGGTPNGKSARYIGMAPGAQLVIASPSSTGGFPDDAILRGTNFVFNRADAMGLPVVVNLSLGGDFGPHDGTSPLEKGLSAFVGDSKPGHVIVVAAGNSGGLYQVNSIKPLGVHTTVHVGDHEPVSVPVITPGATSGKVFVWITFRPGDVVKVGLHGPDGSRWLAPVAPGNDAGHDAGNGTNGSIINDEVNGLSSLTSDTNGAIVSWTGSWQAGAFNIDLEGSGDAELWVEAEGAAAQAGAFFERGLVEGSVSTPASAPALLAVGCTINRISWPSIGGEVGISDGTMPDDVCFFSGAGPTPTGVPKPEILAPGGFIVGAMSFDADPRTHTGSIFDPGSTCPPKSQCYVVDEGYAVTSGTSMSAPHVTGGVALLLDHNPNLTQAEVTDILQASARLPTGLLPYQSQIGPGAMNLAYAMDVMGQEPMMGTPPDPTTSWWTVSAELARPDTSFPIWGTVELRHADGTVAGGLDGSKLTVVADGGVVTSTPAKVSYGLFRFSVAGAPGLGDTTMHVQVLYDGQPIGAPKDIAIAVDDWIRSGSPLATGGCQGCAIGQGGGSDVAPVALLAAVLMRLSRRRRRDRR